MSYWANDWLHWSVGLSEAVLAFAITSWLTRPGRSARARTDRHTEDYPTDYRIGDYINVLQPLRNTAFTTPPLTAPARVWSIGDASSNTPWIATPAHEGPCDCGCRDVKPWLGQLKELAHLQSVGVLTNNEVRTVIGLSHGLSLDLSP